MLRERQYQNGLPICLEIFCRVLQNTAVQKGVPIFVIVTSFLL